MFDDIFEGGKIAETDCRGFRVVIVCKNEEDKTRSSDD